MFAQLRLCCLILASLLFTYQSFSQYNYEYSIDLKNVKEDKVKVELRCPKIKEPNAIFVIPRVIPGSYSWKEYGRFLSEIKGFDSLGNEIKISRKKNIFYIKKEANRLRRIEYWVGDTWDDTDLKNFIFQPGGSNIETNKNFVLNGHAFMGYFEGYKDYEFVLSITKPENLYGSTYLNKEIIRSDLDRYKVKNYFSLSDNPIMYCIPDTASFLVDDTRIRVSSFSNTGIVKADSLAKWLLPLTFSLKNFLGKLPIDEYHFIFYFGSKDQLVDVPKGGGLSGYGALEHNHCSFYYLPEKTGGGRTVREMVQDVGAHEFLHIITPLNLHSEEISDFNFRKPKMSKHLWMYEGITEYFSWLVRVQNNLVTEKEFIDEMRDKLISSDQFGLFSFTEMSEHVLEPEYQKKYSDVYLKGAIYAMMIDQLIIKKSNGERDLKDIMLVLMSRYGPDKAFVDDDFIEEFTALTYPEVGDFINRYIVNTALPPLEEQFEWFGFSYTEKISMNCYFIGYFSYRLNEQEYIEIGKVTYSPDLEMGDRIIQINDTKVSDATWDFISENYLQFNTSPRTLKVKFLRNGKTMSLDIIPMQGVNQKRHTIRLLNQLKPEQKKLKDRWLLSNQN